MNNYNQESIKNLLQTGRAQLRKSELDRMTKPFYGNLWRNNVDKQTVLK